MKGTVFVRPNLKLLLVGALLVLFVQHLILNGRSQGTGVLLPVAAREDGSDDIRELLRRASEHPTADVHMRLSLCFEKRGEYRRALIHLRKAETLREAEDSDE